MRPGGGRGVSTSTSSCSIFARSTWRSLSTGCKTGRLYSSPNDHSAKATACISDFRSQYLEKIGYPLDDAAFRAAETDTEVVPPLLEALLNGSIPYHAMPEPILEVPARFADALILGAPSPAPVGAPKPLVDPQELMRGALRLLPRSA